MAEKSKTVTKKKTVRSNSETDSINLEQAFSELENIITRLESDTVPLRESIDLYGQGANLLAACKAELSGIEKEMIVISENFEENGEE